MLKGKVAIVTGASRGIGKGIAVQLGAAGATVYVTGRTLNPRDDKPGISLVEVAREIEDAGGVGVPVQCDHKNEGEIKAVFDRVSSEQEGRLDVLVNNCYQAVDVLEQSVKNNFWEIDPGIFEVTNNVGLKAHYVASVYAARMMVPRKRGLILNISSLGSQGYAFTPSYGIGKCAVDRMAIDCGLELRQHKVAFVVLSPGPVLTETFTKLVANIRLQLETDAELVSKSDLEFYNLFKDGESCQYVGQCVANLAAEPNIMNKSCGTYLTAEVGIEYGLTDCNGRRPINHRSLSGALQELGYTWLARLIPGFIPMPWWAIQWAMYSHFVDKQKST